MARKAAETEIAEPAVDRIAPLRAFLGREDARIDAVMEPLRACYARTGRDDRIEAQMLRLIRSSLKKRYPKRPEGDDNRKAGVGFVVVGGSGSGKTAALEHLLVDHPAFPGYGVVGSCTFVSVLCPAPSTLAQLGNETLIALGYPPDKPLAEAVAWNRVRRILKKTRVMFLHYDDVHNVLQQKDANPKELKKIQATFRNLLISRIWPVQLVLSGVGETLDIFKKDRQLKRRLHYVTFKDLVADEAAGWVGEAVRDFARQAGLKYVEKPGVMLVDRLIHAAAYQFGLVFELLLDAIENALLAKRRTFGIDDFIEAYAERTSQPEELNIFESPGWQVIDPGIIFEKENEDEEAGPKKKRSRKSEVSFDG
jgi:hypothetical protein